MSLVITTHAGATLNFNCAAVTAPGHEQAPSRFSGLETADQVTFFFSTYTRQRLPELTPHAALNVVQTPNRKRIQLTSSKLCSFVKFRWNGPRYQIDTLGWNELYTYGEMLGVFAVTEATVRGFEETMALTVYRGDWLWQGGQPINFETVGGGA